MASGSSCVSLRSNAERPWGSARRAVVSASRAGGVKGPQPRSERRRRAQQPALLLLGGGWMGVVVGRGVVG
jgi:hypothetical protein